MKDIPHWHSGKSIRVAQSKGGVLVTTHPADNLVHFAASPWQSPELLQKFYASTRFRGATPEDDTAARSGLGHYCDLQSLNSEDAVTWSVFGNLAYCGATERHTVVNRLLNSIGEEPLDDPPVCWLWRRLPHPEKPESSGGPEIDFAFLSRNTLVLGEAKWNSSLGVGQGIDGNRSQLDLRVQYCEQLALRALPGVRRHIVLGVGRGPHVFGGAESTNNRNVHIRSLTWDESVQCFDGEMRLSLDTYLQWKERYSDSAPQYNNRAE